MYVSFVAQTNCIAMKSENILRNDIEFAGTLRKCTSGRHTAVTFALHHECLMRSCVWMACARSRTTGRMHGMRFFTQRYVYISRLNSRFNSFHIPHPSAAAHNPLPFLLLFVFGVLLFISFAKHFRVLTHILHHTIGVGAMATAVCTCAQSHSAPDNRRDILYKIHINIFQVADTCTRAPE